MLCTHEPTERSTLQNTPDETAPSWTDTRPIDDRTSSRKGTGNDPRVRFPSGTLARLDSLADLYRREPPVFDLKSKIDECNFILGPSENPVREMGVDELRQNATS